MSEKKWGKLRLIRRPRGPEHVAPCEPELRALLDEWDAPSAPPSLDARVFAAYRAGHGRALLWRRVWGAKLSLPVPLATACALLMVVGGWLAWRGAIQPVPPPALPTVETKIVAVPVVQKVVQERVVTRTVYVARPHAAPALIAANNPSRRRLNLASQVAGDSAYTSVNLDGFQPVDEIKVTVIKGSAHNAK